MKESSDQCTPFFRRRVVVAAVLFIICPMLVNATDLNRAPVNKLSPGLNADSFRMVFSKNYVELPLGQTVWIDGTGDSFNPSNWSAGVPALEYIAQINNGGLYKLRWAERQQARSIGDCSRRCRNLSTSGSGSVQDERARCMSESRVRELLVLQRAPAS